VTVKATNWQGTSQWKNSLSNTGTAVLNRLASDYRSSPVSWRQHSKLWSLYARDHCNSTTAGDAAAGLVELYRSQGQVDWLWNDQFFFTGRSARLQLYGLMNTYDQMDQLYLKREVITQKPCSVPKKGCYWNNWIINRLTLLNRFHGLQIDIKLSRQVSLDVSSTEVGINQGNALQIQHYTAWHH